MVRQANCIVVTVSDKNEVQAFKVVQSDDSPLFNIIKADKQARIKETAVTAEALLPSGPYDLWREGDTEHLVNDLASAFAHFAQLPKMLNRKAIFETLLDGCQQGLFVLRSNRKDGSFKTYWYEAPPLDTLNSKDFNFAVVLSEVATLASLPSHLLSPDVLPELWQGPELRLRDLYDYFSGGKFVKSGEYGETIAIPRAERSSINEAIQTAVKEKRLWLLSGQASFLSEDVPLDFLMEDATLQAPPQPIPSRDIMPESLPEAWNGKDETTALAISDALSTKLRKVLPWITVREAIQSALNARWLERAADSGPLSDYASARAVKICQRKEQAQQQPEPRTEQPVTYAGLSSSQPGLLVAEAGLSVDELQDFYEKIGEILKAAAEINSKIAFRVRMELNASSQPPQDAVEKINKLLQEVSTELELRSN